VLRRVAGLDFGTTNSAIAVATSKTAVRLATFPEDGRLTETFRSILYFFHPFDSEARARYAAAGPQAIQAYFAAEPRGRLIQSLKSFLASRTFTQTTLYKSFYTLEDLIAIIIGELRSAAERQFGELEGSVVVGRPARFSGAKDQSDDDFAISRLEAAVKSAGFQDVYFEYEPVAAAYSYERQLDHDELVLIADFGGGTSDFSLLQVGPSSRGDRAGGRRILATDGVAIAGNDFDSKLMRHLVAPELGLLAEYRSNQKLLPVPSWIFKELERWHHLSFLKTQKTLGMLASIKQDALDPRKIANLIHVIDGELGFKLYKSIEHAKLELSNLDSSLFEFRDGPVDIARNVTRAGFERWIEPYIRDMATCLDRLLEKSNASRSDIDSVFMTGGSSFVPAVRRLFEGKFGASRLRSGHELTSVAEGLGLRALSLL
jgi:hypothetical chaperone protein